MTAGWTDAQVRLKALLVRYAAGGSAAAAREDFAAWAAAAGLGHECRKGVEVALDGSGRVVAFLDGRSR